MQTEIERRKQIEEDRNMMQKKMEELERSAANARQGS
jgi:hypothetical protein